MGESYCSNLSNSMSITPPQMRAIRGEGAGYVMARNDIWVWHNTNQYWYRVYVGDWRWGVASESQNPPRWNDGRTGAFIGQNGNPGVEEISVTPGGYYYAAVKYIAWLNHYNDAIVGNEYASTVHRQNAGWPFVPSCWF